MSDSDLGRAVTSHLVCALPLSWCAPHDCPSAPTVTPLASACPSSAFQRLPCFHGSGLPLGPLLLFLNFLYSFDHASPHFFSLSFPLRPCGPRPCVLLWSTGRLSGFHTSQPSRPQATGSFVRAGPISVSLPFTHPPRPTFGLSARPE